MSAAKRSAPKNIAPPQNRPSTANARTARRKVCFAPSRLPSARLCEISTERVNFLLIAVLAVLYYGFSLFIIRLIKDTTPKAMVAPMYFYLFCNSTMNIFAMMQLLSRPTLAAAVAYAGALLFFASDCCLFLVRYYKTPEIIYKKHFTVMLTYLLGELLIVVGVLMLHR